MTRHVLNQILESEPKYPHNLLLLKKIILTCYFGYFRINNLAPDNKISLGDYLFDEERMMFDYTKLSPHHKDLFLKWLLEPHAEDEKRIQSTTYTNEDRGYTAEVSLNWWGRFINKFRRTTSPFWKICSFKFAFNHQLLGIQIDQGKYGSLIEFRQFDPPGSGSKYCAENQLQIGALGNTKRVYLTDKMVEQILASDVDSFNFRNLYTQPHPQSVEVVDHQSRHVAMRDYRKTQLFKDSISWYQKLWRWISSFFQPKAINVDLEITNHFKTIYSNKTISLLQREHSNQILLKETKPEVESLVFCGGGAKIFAHVGVWKALCEAKIKPKNFIGSSAGAMMSLLCYLGFTAEEINALFQEIRQEHLILFHFDFNGFSEPHSLKTALDYAIAFKIKQIVDKYSIPFPEGKITFATLENIKQQCPGCGIGQQLIVTATNLKLDKISYFSLKDSPTFEVSEAVKISASMPVIFRPTKINGALFADGGVKSNFPTEACYDDHSTLLEFTNLLAVQFDNGTERAAIDGIDQVYREGWFANWIFSKITGVSDPATGWYEDRMKLRKFAAQTIVPRVDVSSSSFGIDDKARNKLIENGYEAAKDYLNARYEINTDGQYKSTEGLHATFDSFADLLVYCCYRDNVYWFDLVTDLIKESTSPQKVSLIKQASILRNLYFKESPQNLVIKSLINQAKELETTTKGISFFKKPPEPPISSENYLLLLDLHPLFRRISSDLVLNKPDKNHVDKARHALTLDKPFKCLKHFNKIQESHILLNIIIRLLTELDKDKNKEHSVKIISLLKQMGPLLDDKNELVKPAYFGKWDLTLPQCFRLLKLFEAKDKPAVLKLLDDLKKRAEPLQIIKDGVFYENKDPHCLEDNRINLRR